MNNKKYAVLLGLIGLILLLSMANLLISILPGPKSQRSPGYSPPVTETEAHLFGLTGKGDRVLARVDGNGIARSELLRQFESLPPEMVIPFDSREDTLNFLEQFIGLELVYQQALKQGLGQDSSVLVQTQQAKKQIMIDAYLSQKLADRQFSPSQEEVKEFYQTNQALLGDRTLEQARQEISEILARQYRRTAYQELVNTLWDSAQIEIYEDSL
jgi:hypothetical protein